MNSLQLNLIDVDSSTVCSLTQLNGREVANEEKENFRNTISWKPKSLEGRIILFKGYSSGFWVQDRSKTSNFNIFNSMMSMDDMLSRTLGGDNCSTPGDYIRC